MDLYWEVKDLADSCAMRYLIQCIDQLDPEPARVYFQAHEILYHAMLHLREHDNQY